MNAVSHSIALDVLFKNIYYNVEYMTTSAHQTNVRIDAHTLDHLLGHPVRLRCLTKTMH